MKGHQILYWLGVEFFAICGRAQAVSQTNFWQQTNGPYWGPIRALAINSSGYIIAVGNGGVFCSTDNGASWAQVN